MADIEELIERLKGIVSECRNDDCYVCDAVTEAALSAQQREIAELRALLRRIEPHLDAIICYASTMGEHEPNRIAFDVRAALNKQESLG